MQYLRLVTYALLLIGIWFALKQTRVIPVVLPYSGIDDSWSFSLNERTSTPAAVLAARLTVGDALRIADIEAGRRNWEFKDKRVGLVTLRTRSGRLIWTVQLYDGGSSEFEITIDDATAEPVQGKQSPTTR